MCLAWLYSLPLKLPWKMNADSRFCADEEVPVTKAKAKVAPEEDDFDEEEVDVEEEDDD